MRATCRVYTPRANTDICALYSGLYSGLYPALQLHMAYQRLRFCLLPVLGLVFAALPCAAGIADCAFARGLPDARRAPRRPVGGLAQTSKVELFKPFMHAQAAWAFVKTVQKTCDVSINVASFFLPGKLLERLALYLCTVVVNRLAETSIEFRFMVAEAVLAAWLACTGSQVAPAFQWRRVLERFSVYLLLLVQCTMLKSRTMT